MYAIAVYPLVTLLCEDYPNFIHLEILLMGKLPKPYMKCEKIDGAYHLTLMGSGVRGHVLLGRAVIPMDDPLALQKKVKEMILKARTPVQS